MATTEGKTMGYKDFYMAVKARAAGAHFEVVFGACEYKSAPGQVVSKWSAYIDGPGWFGVADNINTPEAVLAAIDAELPVAKLDAGTESLPSDVGPVAP